MINKIKFLSVIGAASTILFSTPAAYAQIPVTDAASIAKQAAAQLETMVKWKTQYDQMVSQIDQQKQQYQSVTGSRGLGNILNDPKMRNYLPNDWQKVYDSVKNGGYAGLTGTAQSVYDQNKVFDSCAHITNSEQRTACEARAVKPAQDKAFALDAYDAAKNRINQIDQLMEKINTTQDPKAIAELQGRIAAEQANIQNEQTKLQLYSMVAAAEEKVQVQRAREMSMKDAAKRGGLNIEPMDFSLRK